MKNVLIALLIICCFSTTFAYETKIKFSERVYSTVNISYTDIFKDTYVLQLDQQTPQKSVITKEATWFYLGGNSFWLFPDEEIDLYRDSMVMHGSPYDILKRNNDLYFLSALRQQKGKTLKNLFAPQANRKIKKIVKSIRSQKDSLLAYADAYCIDKPLSDTFKSLFRQTVEASYTNELLKTVTRMKRKIKDLDSKDQAMIEQCLSYDVMIPAVEDYIQYYIYVSGKGKDSTYRATEKEYLATKLPAQSLERIIFIILRNNLLKNIAYEGPYTETDITDNTYRIYLDKLQRYKAEDSKEKMLLTIDGRKLKFMKLLKDSANNFCYVYFWNTASPESVKQIKKCIELRAQNPNSPVSIMFVSLDENPLTWSYTCKELGIDKLSNNYLAPRNYTSVLAESFKVRSVPRSVVLDSDGYVISFDAPLPTTDNLRFLEERYHKFYGNK